MRIALISALTLVLLASRMPGESKKADANAEKPVKPVKVPFELLKSGHIAVQVKVNGKGPYRLIFDTGAPMSLVNNKLAKESGLLEGVEKPPFALFGSMGEAKMKTLDVGGVQVKD